jgi:hypothetical protein
VRSRQFTSGRPSGPHLVSREAVSPAWSPGDVAAMEPGCPDQLAAVAASPVAAKASRSWLCCLGLCDRPARSAPAGVSPRWAVPAAGASPVGALAAGFARLQSTAMPTRPQHQIAVQSPLSSCGNAVGPHCVSRFRLLRWTSARAVARRAVRVASSRGARGRRRECPRLGGPVLPACLQIGQQH